MAKKPALKSAQKSASKPAKVQKQAKPKQHDPEREKVERHLQRLIDELPRKPGVYQFKDKDGAVLYVGKAKNLNNRVRSYFHSAPKESTHIEVMRKKITDIEIITVRSDLEALILETNLIKQLKPRYNIVMRDDKNFVYVKITMQQDFPEVYTVRRMMKDGAKYFGPYTSNERIFKTLKVLQKIFPFRSCLGSITQIDTPSATTTAKHITDRPTPASKEDVRQGSVVVRIQGLNRMAPCLDYHIKRCSGPCAGAISKVAYRELISNVMRFLEGKTDDIVQSVHTQMQQAAQTKQFEHAAKLRDQLRALEGVLEKQHIISTKQEDQDVISVAAENDMAVANVFRVRGGTLIGRETFPLKRDAHTAEDQNIVERFVSQYYSEAADIPREVLVSVWHESFSVLEEFLTELAGRSVHIHVPERGDKMRLLELAQENARRSLEEMKVRWMTDEARTKGALKELEVALHITPIRRIECYDISHVQGTSTVASMVVFMDGIPHKAHYRRFKIKSLPEGKTDDFASMMEVLERRIRRIKEILDEMPVLEPAPVVDAVLPMPDGAVPPSDITAQASDQSGAPDQYAVTTNTDDQDSADHTVPDQPSDGEMAVIPPISIEHGTDQIDTDQIVTDAPSTTELPTPEDSFAVVPDLIILDGGKGQLSSVMQVIESMGLTNKLVIIALAKQEEEIFLPNQREPLVLPRGSNGLFLVQRIRDEAHRFALSYHQHIRSKKMVKSALDEIPGIGPALKKKLIATFGSVHGVRDASLTELAAVVGEKAAVKLKEKL